MCAKIVEPNEVCLGCVYHPPNLPQRAYAQEDWEILQARECSFEYAPGDSECQSMRKTNCSLVDLAGLGKP